jgi:DNA-binding MarR family transcriptional regulator
MVAAAQDDGGLDRDAEALHEALSGLVRLYQFRDRDKICCFDVSVTQSHAVQTLTREGPMTLGDLANRLYLEKSTASRVVDALERKGYVERAPHPDDGRALRLSATVAGRRLVEKIRASLVAEAREVISDLSPAVRREGAGLLRRLTQVAARRMGRAPSCCGEDDGCGVPVGSEGGGRKRR